MTDLEGICKEIDRVIKALGGYWPDEWLLPPVIEELGEFSKEFQLLKGLRSPVTISNREKLEEEYGDLLFSVIALGRGLKIDIIKSINNTIIKYSSRKKV